MQIKDVCTRTGLTKKTIRYYESEQLFESEKTLQNGKAFHNYSEKNVQELLRIASLRRARFSIEEIRTMLQTPAETGKIFSQYLERLRTEKSELENILKAAELIQSESLAGPADLADQLQKPAVSYALPPEDIHPRFLYLDEMEKVYKGNSDAKDMTPEPEDYFYLPWKKVVGNERRLETEMNQIDAVGNIKNERHEVQKAEKEYLSICLKVISFVSFWFLIAGVIGFSCWLIGVGKDGETVSWALPASKIGLSIGIPSWGCLRLLDYYRSQKAWRERMKR